MPENLSLYMATAAIVIALTAVLFSLHSQKKVKSFKMIFKKLKNGEELNDKETILLQKLRKQIRSK